MRYEERGQGYRDVDITVASGDYEAKTERILSKSKELTLFACVMLQNIRYETPHCCVKPAIICSIILISDDRMFILA
jgi:hypothetical protein